MGTRDNSKIRKARRLHWCHRCRLGIEPGDRYLDYKIGLMDSVRVHIACALVEHPVYSCNALDRRMNSINQNCEKCKGTGWVCENHADQSFPDHTCCGGAGMPCECNPNADPISGSTVIWTAADGYAS